MLLFQRTKRRVQLTDAGREFYPRVTQVVADLDEAEDYVADANCQISGRIRLALPLGFGVSQLATPLNEFMHHHPEVELDIDLSDRMVDLVSENIDLAIRIGKLEDSNLVARRLTSVHFAICVSPDYLARFGEPEHPDDLIEHEVLVYSNIAAGRQWSWEINGKRISPRLNFRLSANNGEFLAAMACHNLGLVGGPRAYLQGYIERQELVPVLTKFSQPAAGMYAVYPPGRLVSRRVKMLSDALFEYFRKREI